MGTLRVFPGLTPGFLPRPSGPFAGRRTNRCRCTASVKEAASRYLPFQALPAFSCVFPLPCERNPLKSARPSRTNPSPLVLQGACPPCPLASPPGWLSPLSPFPAVSELQRRAFAVPRGKSEFIRAQASGSLEPGAPPPPFPPGAPPPPPSPLPFPLPLAEPSLTPSPQRSGPWRPDLLRVSLRDPPRGAHLHVKLFHTFYMKYARR